MVLLGHGTQPNPRDKALTAAIREGQGDLRRGSRNARRQQQNLLRWPQRKVLSLNIDAGGVQSRKVIERLMAAEAA